MNVADTIQYKVRNKEKPLVNMFKNKIRGGPLDI
jgi:hypothetical protein